MKRNWKIGVLAGCAAVLLTGVFAAAAGNEGDPLITLSYLRNVFTPQVQTMVNDAVAADQSNVKAEADAAISEWDAKINQAVEDALNYTQPDVPASFKTASMSEGASLNLAAGCEIVVRSGAPVCNATLIDQTTGAVLAAGSPLAVNHLYLATGDCALSTTVGSVSGKVNAGPLNVRAGAGTGHSILGTLQKNDSVSIVGEQMDGWYMITSGGLAGYVSADYIDVITIPGTGPASLMLRGTYS